MLEGRRWIKVDQSAVHFETNLVESLTFLKRSWSTTLEKHLPYRKPSKPSLRSKRHVKSQH